MYLFTVSRCGTLCLLDGKSHLFHKDGAVSKPVQFSEAAGSVQKRIISLLWVNSLESPKVSQCICYSYLATTAFDCHMWYLSEHLIASAFFDEKVSHEKRLVVAALRQNVGSEDPLKRIYPSKEPHSLQNFMTTSSLQFLKILKLDEHYSWSMTRASGTTWNSTNGIKIPATQ